MYRVLRNHLPKALANVLCVLIYAAMLITIYMFSCLDDGVFLYMRL
jgi:hypothetical protein